MRIYKDIGRIELQSIVPATEVNGHGFLMRDSNTSSRRERCCGHLVKLNWRSRSCLPQRAPKLKSRSRKPRTRWGGCGGTWAGACFNLSFGLEALGFRVLVSCDECVGVWHSRQLKSELMLQTCFLGCRIQLFRAYLTRTKQSQYPQLIFIGP